MIDAKGDHLELRHDPQRNLQEIRTPQGHWIRFAYDDQSRLKRKVVATLPERTRRDVNVAGAVPEFVKNYHR
jgi:YD repeat-containing protein